MRTWFVPALASLVVFAAGACCSPPKPKPLPGGPPPEYEAPRSFELPGTGTQAPPPDEAPQPQQP